MRLIVWAPGEIGAAALRRALLDPAIDVVGVKVYSDAKHGVDIGTLAGLEEEFGVAATTDVDAILALDADVVIHTPKPFAALEGGDRQVLALLASGKNVVSTLSYFCPALAGTLSEERPLSEQIGMLATASGPLPAPVRGAQLAARLMTTAAGLPLVRPALDGLGPAVLDRFKLRRPAPRRYSEALAAGGTALHGTGLNPGYMAEQVTVALAGLVDGVRHVRFVECGDLSEAPEGMWVGLDGIGFGSDPATVGPTHVFTLGSEIYQPEVVANLGHALFGLHPDEIDQDVDLRALPAKTAITAGGITIEEGQTAVLNQTHLGRRDGEVFYTNEMCWFVGVDNGYYSETVPFGPMGRGGYTMVIDAEPLTLRAQSVTVSGEPGFGAVTDVSVNMVFDALDAVCTSGPGVLSNDMRPGYVCADGSVITAADRWAPGEPRRVALLGTGALADAVAGLAARRADIELVDRAEDADCVVVTDSGHASLEAGGTIHSIGNHAAVIAGRTIKLLARALNGVSHVRYVDALEVDELPAEADHSAVDAAAAAALGVDPGDLAFTVDRREFDGGVHVTRSAEGVTHEIIRYVGAEHAFRGDDLPLGNFTERACITLVITGERGQSGTQIELASATDERAEDLVVAGALLDAVGPACDAPPGVLAVHHGPRYRIDERMPSAGGA